MILKSTTSKIAETLISGPFGPNSARNSSLGTDSGKPPPVPQVVAAHPQAVWKMGQLSCHTAIFNNLSSEASPSGHFVFTGCRTNMYLIPGYPLTPSDPMDQFHTLNQAKAHPQCLHVIRLLHYSTRFHAYGLRMGGPRAFYFPNHPNWSP